MSATDVEVTCLQSATGRIHCEKTKHKILAHPSIPTPTGIEPAIIQHRCSEEFSIIQSRNRDSVFPLALLLELFSQAALGNAIHALSRDGSWDDT